MARIRSIHPDLLVSETMAGISAGLERTFCRLLIHCDDQGRALDNPRLLKAALYPLHDDVTSQRLDAEMEELVKVGLVRRYEVGGSRYLCVPSWDEYQHPRHPSEARIPEPPEPPELPPEGYGETPQASRQTHASVGVGEGVGEGEGVIAAPQSAAREKDPLWDALTAVCGVSGDLTKSERGKFNAALKELREANATPSEIRRRAAVFRGKWPTITLTPNGLSGRWSECTQNGHAVDAGPQVGKGLQRLAAIRAREES